MRANWQKEKREKRGEENNKRLKGTARQEKTVISTIVERGKEKKNDNKPVSKTEFIKQNSTTINKKRTMQADKEERGMYSENE